MQYDTIIVGSGAGGSAAAWQLNHAGQRVLLLEKGHALPTDGSTLDFRRVIAQGAFKSHEPWRDGRGRPFAPEEYFNLGGKTKWYGAALARFARREFEPEASYDCPGWPIDYDTLAPWYRLAETLLGVRAFPVEPDLERIAARLGDGWEAEPLPLALAPEITDDEHEARHFDGFASARGYKADAQTAFLQRLGAPHRLTLRTGHPVRALLPDPASPRRVAGVRTHDGAEHRAERVLLAAGALHSPRLLEDYLERHGAGRIPASRAAVGAGFKRHLLTALIALSPGRKTDLLRKTLLWTRPDCPHSSVQPLGFGADVIAALLPPWVPGPLGRSLAARAYGFFLQTEEGTDPRNRVCAGDGTGDPVLDYDPVRTPRAVAEHRRLVRAFRRSLWRAGLIAFTHPIPLAGTAHACGTLAAGDDPARSAVDAWGRVHGMENLYVVDGSVLPRIGRVNPALTIYAFALRVADHIAREVRHG